MFALILHSLMTMKFYQATFSTTFLKNCGRGESLKTTTCVKTVVGGKQGHAPCEILSLYKTSFFVSIKFNGDHTTAYKDTVKFGHPFLGVLTDIKQWSMSSIGIPHGLGESCNLQLLRALLDLKHRSVYK